MTWCDRSRTASGLWIRLVAALLLSSGCTLLSDFAIHQCESNQDCDTLADRIRRCEASRCVDGCADNHHCAIFDPRAPICPSPGAQCARLTSEDGSCYLSSSYDDATMGPLHGDDMTIVGAFAPSVKSSTWLTLQLAADELNGARVVSDPGLLAPTLVVLCDGSVAQIKGSMDHLVKQLHARTLVSSLDDLSLQIAREEPDLIGKSLLLSPNSASVPPAGPDSDMVWYLGGEYAAVAADYAPLIRSLSQAPALHGSGSPGLRIASLISAAPEDQALADSVESRIDVEGRNAEYLFREDRFQRFVLADDAPERRTKVLAALTAFAPDLVLVFAGGAFSEPAAAPRLSALQTLEELASAGSWSPLYLLGPRALDDGALVQLAATSDSFRARAVGLTSVRAPDAPVASGVLSRFIASFPEADPVKGGVGPSLLAYDALYYLAYASTAAPKGSFAPTAEAMLDGLSRVADDQGQCVDVGPAGIPNTLQHIANGDTFQVCGTTGPARFAPDHTRSGAVRLFCWSLAPGQRLAGAAAEAVDSASVETNLSLGNAPCQESPP